MGGVERARRPGGRCARRAAGSTRPSAAISARRSVPSTRRIADVEHAVLVAGVEDRDDVRVVDRGGDHRLAPEALAEARVLGVLGQDQLEGDLALERELLGAVDDAHVAVADDLLDAAPGEDRARAGARRRAARSAAGRPWPAEAGAAAARARRRRGGWRPAGGRRAAAEARRRWRAAAGGGGRGGGGGGGAAAAGGGADAPGSVSSSVVRPTRTESPAAARAARHAHAVHERPVRRPEVLDRQPAAGVAVHARVAARQLGVVAQPALSALGAPDHELVVERQPVALRRRRRSTTQLLGASARATAAARRAGRLRDAARRRRSPAARSGPAARRRRGGASRASSIRSPLTNVPFAEPEVLDRQLALRRRAQARAWRREISGSSPSLPVGLVGGAPDEQRRPPPPARRRARCPR